ncbi:hypothetical protein PFLUV_G00035860 [Perca fluviatilis]|uniref:Uncharacterized protein n=1 Tax=Perca fluviatilis TaxID=8168 RepID=A0A6A5FMM5_PERFL|nr:hypothetical protein PFLUV_G00035860 [Perca fluviatilis]
MQHGGSAGLRERPPPSSSPPHSSFPSLSRLAARVPAGEGARTGGGGGCARSCSLCSLTPVAAPTHCTPAPPPSDRGCSLSPVVCQCLSPSIPTLLPFALLSGFFPREPAEVPPGRRFCPIHSDCRNPWTAARNLPALLLLPHGPASLRRSCCCCCCRRVEGDPDPTLFLRPDTKRTKTPHDEDCSVSWSSWSVGSLLLLLLLLLLGDFLGFLSGSEG